MSRKEQIHEERDLRFVRCYVGGQGRRWWNRRKGGNHSHLGI